MTHHLSFWNAKRARQQLLTSPSVSCQTFESFDDCGGQIGVASLAAVQTGIFDRLASKRRYTKVPVALEIRARLTFRCGNERGKCDRRDVLTHESG